MARATLRHTAAGDEAPLPVITSLDDLVLVAGEVERPLYVRWSAGPHADRGGVSRDHESGTTMPGLSVHPLTPPSWWRRPVRDWLARQVCSYRHLGDEHADRLAWMLTGHVTDEGPDNEPLLDDWEPLGELSRSLLDEADEHYSAVFDRGRATADR